jgi:hypothetical protein
MQRGKKKREKEMKKEIRKTKEIRRTLFSYLIKYFLLTPSSKSHAAALFDIEESKMLAFHRLVGRSYS